MSSENTEKKLYVWDDTAFYHGGRFGGTFGAIAFSVDDARRIVIRETRKMAEERQWTKGQLQDNIEALKEDLLKEPDCVECFFSWGGDY